MKILSYDLDNATDRLMLKADIPVTVECEYETVSLYGHTKCIDGYLASHEEGQTDFECPKCHGTGRRQMVAKVRVEVNHGIIDLDTAKGYNERIVWNYKGIESHNTLGKLIQDILTRLEQGETVEGVGVVDG
jgi:hypothetical protein